MGKIRLIALDLELLTPITENAEKIMKKIAEYKEFCDDEVFLFIYGEQSHAEIEKKYGVKINAMQIPCDYGARCDNEISGADGIRMFFKAYKRNDLIFFVPLVIFGESLGIKPAEILLITKFKNETYQKHAEKELGLNVITLSKERDICRELERIFAKNLKNLS
ncbi:MAG: hypothetical protein M1170_01050 [Patescibacteria group bacterium]|nr:hypothetical protein [Patescibacteria group bacterium]